MKRGEGVTDELKVPKVRVKLCSLLSIVQIPLLTQINNVWHMFNISTHTRMHGHIHVHTTYTHNTHILHTRKRRSKQRRPIQVN